MTSPSSARPETSFWRTPRQPGASPCAWCMAGASSPARPVHAGDIDAIGLIHEVMHRAIAVSGGSRGSALRCGGSRFPGQGPAFGQHRWDAGDASRTHFRRCRSMRDCLRRAGCSTSTDGVTNRDIDLEELLLVWVANQNPAFMVYGELYDDGSLEGTEYRADRRAACVPTRSNARRPNRVARISWRSCSNRVGQRRGRWAGQLRWILDELAGRHRRGPAGPPDALAGHPRRGGDTRQSWPGSELPAVGTTLRERAACWVPAGEDEYERFSQDREWMPSVVLMAKSTYVWLDQLSRRYGRAIWTLDAIPDEELDRLAEFGVTGLWLIGLWERSHASQRIKQLRGNSEAVASAYSLMDYRIAEDLGGESAWENLRDRAWARRHPPGQRHGAQPHGHRLPLGGRTPGLVPAAPGAAISGLLVQRTKSVQRRARWHLPRGPLLRQLGRRGGLQAPRPLERPGALYLSRQRWHVVPLE